MFLVLGFLVVMFSGEAERLEFGWGMRYSIDQFLPISKLRELHYEPDKYLKGGVRHYFYVHKIAGYVLVSFLIAELSGLVKSAHTSERADGRTPPDPREPIAHGHHA